MHFVNLRQHYSVPYLGHPVLQNVSALQHRSNATTEKEKEEKIEHCHQNNYYKVYSKYKYILLYTFVEIRYLLVYKYLAVVV